MSDDVPTNKDYVIQVLENELKNATVVREPIVNMLDTRFPEDTLPVSVDETLNNLRGTSYVNNRWVFAPNPSAPTKTGEKEKEMENFLHSIIAAAIKDKVNVKPNRIWTADFAETSPRAALFTDIERKPDLLAIPPGQVTSGMKSKDL